MITIVGNGPAGLVLERICQLKDWEHRLLGEDRSPKNRLILLTPSNLEFLIRLGFDIPIHKAYPKLRISTHLSKIPCYLPAKTQNNPLCYGIWLNDLHKALKAYSKPILSPVISGKLSPLSLETEDDTFLTDYIFGCDGAASLTSKIANIGYKTRPPYHCMVIPANIEGNLLIQKHSPHIILAAIPDEKGSIILSSQTPLNHLTPTVETLQKLIGSSLELKAISDPIHHILTPQVAMPCFQGNTFLFGNAALVIEPVTAKGLNHTLYHLQRLHKLSNLEDLPKLATKIQDANQQLFSQMKHLINPSSYSRFKQKLGFYSQLFSPIFQDALLYFGDPHD